MSSANDIAKYFLELSKQSNDDGITNMKLQKLCYYAQGHFLAFYDKPLFQEPIKAWKHGCVIPSLYHEYKDFGGEKIITSFEFDKFAYSDDVHIMIYDVYKSLGQYTAAKLSDLNHKESPWLKNVEANGIVSHDEMKLYFRKHPRITLTEEDEEDEEDFRLGMSAIREIRNGSQTYTLEEINAILGL